MMAGPWRLLLLDSSTDDPKWLLATITLPSDVRPAVMQGRRYSDWPEVTDWVGRQVGAKPSLVPISAVVWRVDEM